jgi:hypothetical protein
VEQQLMMWIGTALSNIAAVNNGAGSSNGAGNMQQMMAWGNISQ